MLCKRSRERLLLFFYGVLQFADWDERKLISVELIDEDENVIKSYKKEDYPDVYKCKDYFTITSIFDK